MSDLSLDLADFTSRTLSRARAALLFPELGISIIETRCTPRIRLGHQVREWDGRDDSFLMDCGYVDYDLGDGTTTVFVHHGVPNYHRERLYRIALMAAVQGPERDGSDDHWTKPETTPDGRTVRTCFWIGRCDDDGVVDQLIDELSSTKEDAR